jgi:catechol 2,3-dioxygenase-like lactoylglutathione lyase family enzyme
MVSNMTAVAVLPAANIERARKFYADKLGLTPDRVEVDGSLFYQCKESTFLVYQTQYAGTAKNTAIGFRTDNIDREMKELRSRGVVFEEYDMPGLKTVNGVATMGSIKAAWFKDSEGNILAVNQM